MKGGKYIKRLRKESGVASQVEMAKKVGKKPERINEYERDVYAIKLVDFLDMAKKLNVKDLSKILKD